MFSSINFLFLLSLGFVSWIILCYIHQIELIHPYIRRTAITRMAEPDPRVIKTAGETPRFPSQPISNSDKYDTYVNFLGIFVCIYALAKITHLAEVYMAKRLRHNVYIPTAVIEGLDMNTDSLTELQEQQENLKCKISKLEKQNQEMKFKLKTVESKTLSQGSDNSDPTDMDENIRCTIITSKHIRLNRQLYVNKDEISRINMEGKSEIGNNNFETWDKYFQLQKCALGKPIISPFKHVPNELNVSMPVVMSSQELDNVQGIF